MTTTWDFDEIVASSEIDVDPRREQVLGSRKNRDFEALESEFYDALRNDVDLLIDLAKAATKAAERAREIKEEERAAFDPATDPVEARRLRGKITYRRWVRGKAQEALETSEAAQSVEITR